MINMTNQQIIDILASTFPNKKVLQLIPMPKDQVILVVAPLDWDSTKPIPADNFLRLDKATCKLYEYSPLVEIDKFNKYSANAITISPVLMHHGIKGQKWGVRNWQNEDGSLTDAGRAHYGYGTGGRQYGVECTYNNYIIALDSLRREVARTENGSYKESALIVKEDSRYFNGEKGISQKDLATCNREYGAAGTTVNCTKCAATLELYHKGYTGILAGRLSAGTDDAKSMHKWFKGARTVDVSRDASKKYFREEIGANKSGVLGFAYAHVLSGHEVHWTTDDKGNVTIQDGQIGWQMGYDEFLRRYNVSGVFPISITRLDNCEPDWEQMGKDSVIRIAGNSQIMNASTGDVSKDYKKEIRWEEIALTNKVIQLYKEVSAEMGDAYKNDKEAIVRQRASDPQTMYNILRSVSTTTFITGYLGFMASFLASVVDPIIGAIGSGASLATVFAAKGINSAANNILKTEMNNIYKVFDDNAEELKDLLEDFTKSEYDVYDPKKDSEDKKK